MYCPSCGTRLITTQHEETDFPHFYVSMSVYRCRDCQTGWKVGYDSQDMRHAIMEVHLDEAEVEEDDIEEVSV